MMTRHLALIHLKVALQKGELVTLECKRAQKDVPVDAWKTYSASPTHTAD